MQTIQLFMFKKAHGNSAVPYQCVRVELKHTFDSGIWAINTYFHNYISAN